MLFAGMPTHITLYDEMMRSAWLIDACIGGILHREAHGSTLLAVHLLHIHPPPSAHCAANTPIHTYEGWQSTKRNLLMTSSAAAAWRRSFFRKAVPTAAHVHPYSFIVPLADASKKHKAA